MVTNDLGYEWVLLIYQFPINRCHQRVVTLDEIFPWKRKAKAVFPINRCHQRVVTRDHHITEADRLPGVSNQ